MFTFFGRETFKCGARDAYKQEASTIRRRSRSSIEWSIHGGPEQCRCCWPPRGVLRPPSQCAFELKHGGADLIDRVDEGCLAATKTIRDCFGYPAPNGRSNRRPTQREGRSRNPRCGRKHPSAPSASRARILASAHARPRERAHALVRHLGSAGGPQPFDRFSDDRNKAALQSPRPLSPSAERDHRRLVLAPIASARASPFITW